MTARLAVLAVLALLGSAMTIVSLLAYVAVARVLQIPLVDASLGFGPKLLQTRLLGVPLTVRALLFGCYVRPWPLPDDASPADASTDLADTPAGRPLSSRALPVRAAFALLPLLTAFVAAALAHRAMLPTRLASDGSTLLRGAISPLTHARGTLAVAAEVGATQGFFALGLRLLPVFALSQLSALSNLATLAARPATGVRVTLVGATTFALFLLMLAWLVAIATWLVS